ncbi:MAG: HD domain-containing phosphohydrolase [Dehalococcoidia bacterium]
MEQVPFPVFVCDGEGRNLFANAAYGRLVRRPVDDLLGERWKSLIPAAELVEYEQGMRAGMAQHGPFTLDLAAVGARQRRQYEIQLTPIEGREAEAGPALWLGVVQNLTRQHEAEAHVAELSNRYRNIISGSPVCFVSADRTGRIMLVDASDSSPSIRRWVGRTFQEIVAGDALAEEGLRLVMEEGIPATRRVEDGARIYQVNWYPLFDLHGALRGVDAVASDVSERVRFDEQLRDAFDGVIGVITQLTDLADPYTRGHEETVADIAEAIARELGIDERSIEGLRVAARLHDTGKIAVPAVLLARPGALNEAEFNLIKTHVDNARRIFDGIDFPWPEIEAIYEHHERLDGSGYPLGLRGDEIGYAGRILAVADICDAMTSHRPYRPARSLDELVGELSRCRDVHYDGLVVDAAIGLIESGRMPFRQSLGADRHGEVRRPDGG